MKHRTPHSPGWDYACAVARGLAPLAAAYALTLLLVLCGVSFLLP